MSGVESTVGSNRHTANRWKCSGAVGAKRQMDSTADAGPVWKCADTGKGCWSFSWQRADFRSLWRRRTCVHVQQHDWSSSCLHRGMTSGRSRCGSWIRGLRLGPGANSPSRSYLRQKSAFSHTWTQILGLLKPSLISSMCLFVLWFSALINEDCIYWFQISIRVAYYLHTASTAMKSMCVCSHAQLSDDPTEECYPEAASHPQAELCCSHYVVILYSFHLPVCRS